MLHVVPSWHTTSRGRPVIWFFFGRDVLDHKRTKGRIRFLTDFGSASCVSNGVCRFGKFLGRSWDISPKAKEYAIANLLVYNTHIWWTKTENIPTETRFVLIFKTKALGDISRTFLTERTLQDVIGVYKMLLGGFYKNKKL